MRVVGWNPAKADPMIMGASMGRLEKAGEVIAKRARQKCPVGMDVPKGKGKWSARDAGALRDSIRVVRLLGDDRKNIRVYAGSKKVFYARFVERGTVKMKKRPYLRPALSASKSDIKRILLYGE